MPLRWVEPQLYLEHKGIKIFYTYRHDTETEPSESIFTTDEADSDRDSDSEFHFDVRDMRVELSQKYVSAEHFPAGDEVLLKTCIEYGLVPIPPDIILGSLAEQLEDSELLLELVHDVASRGATNVNNSGPLDQLRYLVDNVGLEETRKLVTEILDRSKGVK